MFELFDVVTLLVDLPDHELQAGAQGTVVEVFTTPHTAYEVENVQPAVETEFAGALV